MDKINNDRKTLIDLALKAGKKRQSEQTGYVHHCYENASEEHCTIPVFDNFCFCLALFKSRLSEHVLEGKELLKKLLKFQVGDNFPVYLHEYPECRSLYLGSSIQFVLQIILLEFSHVLGSEIKSSLDISINALKTRDESSLRMPKTPAEWGDALAFSRVPVEEALEFWHKELHACIGPIQYFEKGEPAVTLFDLYMGQLFGSFSRRALIDHPIHLRAALLSPPNLEKMGSNEQLYCYAGSSLFWGGRDKLHSLYCHPKKAILEREVDHYLFHLQETIPEEGEDRHEIAFYATIDPSTILYVNGSRATTFQIGDLVELVSDTMRITFDFILVEGEGKFFGHIMQANRPAHRALLGENLHTAYDWQISLRTIVRSSLCKIGVRSNIRRRECWAVDSDAHSMHAVVDVEDSPCDRCC
ncbi:MAG: hypothetical protein V4494_06490 [Chlamydiota bacterium]